MGATYIKEERPSGGDYQLRGADVTFRATDDTYLKAEFAESEGNTNKEINLSTLTDSGGLGFTTISDPTATKTDGQAFRVEGRVGLSDYTSADGFVEAWYGERDADFVATDGTLTGNGQARTDYGVALSVDPNDDINVQARFEKSEIGSLETQELGAQASYNVNDKLTLTGQVINEQVNDDSAGIDKDRTTAALEAQYRFRDSLQAYINAEGVVDESNWGDQDGSIGIGVKGRANDHITYNADYSHGLGDNDVDNIKVGFGFDLDDNRNIYANLDANLQDGDLQDGGLTIGQNAKINDKLTIYSEHQFRRDERDRTQQVNTFGGDYRLTDAYSVGMSYGQNELGNEALRSASIYGNYNNNENLSFSNRIEWREEERAGKELDQIVLTNNLKYKHSEDLRMIAGADYSRTREKGQPKPAEFAEVDLGVAYRPVENNKLNLLGMYRYTYNRDPLSQTDAQFEDERSHILSVEGIYEIDENWEVGAKGAYKQASYRPRTGGEWQDYNTTLGVVRLRYHMMHNWDALAEYRFRATSNPADSSDSHGGLLAVERHIGENFKVGVGYNFANIDNDLRGVTPSQSRDVSGWFINFVGKY